MIALQIRQVPEHVRDELAGQAAAHGQSLQSYLLELVVTHASRSANSAVLARLAGRSDGTAAQIGETAELIQAERSRRDRRGIAP